MRRNYFGAAENTFALQSLAGGIRARRAHPDQARRQLLEEPQHVSPTQLPADDRTPVRFSAMDLKYLLGQIQTDGGNALRAEEKVVDVKSAVPQLATTRPGRDATIFKMHGDVDRPDEAVATKDDYERYSKDRGAFITALAGDLVSKTFLFLGFTFTDPNLEQVLSQVRLSASQDRGLREPDHHCFDWAV